MKEHKHDENLSPVILLWHVSASKTNPPEIRMKAFTCTCDDQYRTHFFSFLFFWWGWYICLPCPPMYKMPGRAVLVIRKHWAAYMYLVNSGWNHSMFLLTTPGRWTVFRRLKEWRLQRQVRVSGCLIMKKKIFKNCLNCLENYPKCFHQKWRVTESRSTLRHAFPNHHTARYHISISPVTQSGEFARETVSKCNWKCLLRQKDGIIYKSSHCTTQMNWNWTTRTGFQKTKVSREKGKFI